VGILGSKKVAGTVMMHLANGSKKFLMQTHKGTAELASTDFSEDKTGLANILQLFKDSIHLDVTAIDIVELTNGSIDAENIPLFVFETQESGQDKQLPDGYAWEEPNVFRQIIEDYKIEGMPFF
jgi:hypothetical protein